MTGCLLIRNYKCFQSGSLLSLIDKHPVTEESGHARLLDHLTQFLLLCLNLVKVLMVLFSFILVKFALVLLYMLGIAIVR